MVKVLWGSWFPLFWFGASFVVIGKWIVISKEYWEKLDYIRRQALILREQKRIQQRSKYNIILYLFKYFFIKEFRYCAELQVYAVQCRYLVEQGFSYNAAIAIAARSICSKWFLTDVSETYTVYKLKELVEKRVKK